MGTGCPGGDTEGGQAHAGGIRALVSPGGSGDISGPRYCFLMVGAQSQVTLLPQDIVSPWHSHHTRPLHHSGPPCPHGKATTLGHHVPTLWPYSQEQSHDSLNTAGEQQHCMGGTTPQVTLAAAPEVLPVPKPCMGRECSVAPQPSSIHLGMDQKSSKGPRLGVQELGKGQRWEVAGVAVVIVVVLMAPMAVMAAAIPVTAVAPVVVLVAMAVAVVTPAAVTAAVVAVVAAVMVVAIAAVVVAVVAGLWWQQWLQVLRRWLQWLW